MLNVEDGTLVVDADSYMNVATFDLMAEQYGILLKGDEAAKEVLLRHGTMFVDSYEKDFGGERVSPSQSLAFPRRNLSLYDNYVPNDVIPVQVVRATFWAAVSKMQGTELFPSQTAPVVSRETIGPITTEWDVSNWYGGRKPEIGPVVEALSPLLSAYTSRIRIVRG